MASPFIGQILQFAGNFAPQNYAQCNGQLLPISQYDALFNLIGTTYGGDGQNTFALPDLQNRVPIHQGTAQSGTTYVLGQPGGAATVTLNSGNLPTHSHNLNVISANSGGASVPSSQTFVADQTTPINGLTAYFAPTQSSLTTLASGSLGPTGGSLPHNNLQPAVAFTYCIALYGVFPPRN